MKIQSFNALVYFSFMLLLTLSSCSQAESNKGSSADNQPVMTAKAEVPDMDMQTAIITGNLEAVKQHIEAGTPINTKDQLSGSTPLITSVTFGNKAIAEALIDAGADLNLRNNDGATALHAAAFFCRIEIVQLLIDAKADKNLKNNFGATARESVMGPFEEIKPVYDMMRLQLEPIGVTIDMKEIEQNRPVVAMMLQ